MIIDNQIFIKGGTYIKIKQALRQWIELYSENLPEDFTFILYKNGRGNFIINADKRLDNDWFYYLINYLNLPDEIDYNIEIRGYTIGKENNFLKDLKLMVYISSIDTEGDNVFVTTSENNTYKIDFGGNILESTEKKLFIAPTIQNLDNPEILKIEKKKFTLETKDNLNKRFRIILFLLIVIISTSIFVSFYDIRTYITITYFCGMGTALWFFADAKMLQSERYYCYGLIIAMVFLAYTALVKKLLGNWTIQFADLGALYPLIFLLIQWPTRKFYIKLFKREPEIERHGKLADMIYTVILFLALAALPLIIDKYLN